MYMLQLITFSWAHYAKLRPVMKSAIRHATWQYVQLLLIKHFAVKCEIIKSLSFNLARFLETPTDMCVPNFPNIERVRGPNSLLEYVEWNIFDKIIIAKVRNTVSWKIKNIIYM